MSIAAVPNYLGQNFGDASPGMRFGIYLKIWNPDWLKNKEIPRSNANSLNKNDEAVMKALYERQEALFKYLCISSRDFVCDAISVAPFTTGLGNEHPLENGFAFLNPYGLPYLPGSSVKGVLRQAACELASGDWSDTTNGWSNDKRYSLMIGKDNQRKPVLDSKKQPVKLSMIDILFGFNGEDGDKDHVQGVLDFWDVIPQIHGSTLDVEIMTPHQSHYYQWKKDGNENEIEIAPHDSGQPIPIYFLTIPPNSQFVFHIQCNIPRLYQLAPKLSEDNKWNELLQAAFEHAFSWLGFGAKTAVGYGAMKEDPKKKSKREEDEAKKLKQLQMKTRQEELSKMSPEERAESPRD